MSDVVIQRACTDDAPDDDALISWAETALSKEHNAGEVTLRLVDQTEMQSLNRTYRGKDKLTNVLSFPVEADIRSMHGLLGDVVMCPVVIDHEAREQCKERDAHYAHLVIHGVLHLLGFDHIEDEEAAEMEAMETRLLASIGIGDPYVDQTAHIS